MTTRIQTEQTMIALVTGAAQRIGKAITEHLAAKGWDVAIHYNRSNREASTLAEKLSHGYPGQRFMIYKADLLCDHETENLVQAVMETMGFPQLLINNASVFDRSTLAQTSTSFFDRQMTVNLKAPFILMREFINRCGKGMIINMVDTRISGNREDYAAYTLAKKSLWELTKMAAAAYGPAVRVNAIAPGLVLAPEGKDEQYLRQLAADIPMKRPGGLKPILDSLDYLLRNEYLTGELLHCDGGQRLL